MRHLTLISSICAGLLSVAASPLFSQPRLMVNNHSVDLGIIHSNQMYNAQWVIRNTGNDTLVINKLKTSCGCTSVKRLKPTLGPGDFDSLKVEFNPAGFDGKFTKHITFTTNDTSQSSVILILTGEVIRELPRAE